MMLARHTRLATCVLALAAASCDRPQKDSAPAASASASVTIDAATPPAADDTMTDAAVAAASDAAGAADAADAADDADSGAAIPDASADAAKKPVAIAPPYYGNGHSRSYGEHKVMAPKIRQGAITVTGKLPPEVITRIVRQNFGRYRLCYEGGLRNNPSLQGRVAVKFTIGSNGAVKSATDGGSDMPDTGVTSCILRGFADLTFPQPESGEVIVIFPIMFAPGD